MASARFLCENYFNDSQFPSHVITANEETTGNEAWRVGTGRRVGSAVRNYWTPTTVNQDAWVEVLCDRPRAVDTLIIDRGHNLDTEIVAFESSNDNYTSKTSIVSVTMPSNVYANSRLGDSPGVKTTEGAWVISFPTEIALYFRVYITAMGATLRPQLPGVYIGKSFTPTNAPVLPFDEDPRELVYESIVSDSLWSSSSRKARRRAPTARMYMNSDGESDQARLFFRERFQAGEIMWYFPDTDAAEKAMMVEAPPGIDALPYPNNYAQRVVQLSMVEHNPKVL